MSSEYIIPVQNEDYASYRIRALSFFEHLKEPVEVYETGDFGLTPHNLLKKQNYSQRKKAVKDLKFHLKDRKIFLSRKIFDGITRGQLVANIFKNAEYSVYDVDDAIMFPARKYKLPFGGPYVWKAGVLNASQVIVGNEFLAEEALKLRPDVNIIPTCIHPNDYQEKINYEPEKQFTVTWIGSQTTEKYLIDIQDQLKKVHQEGIKLQIISSPAEQSMLGSFEQYVERIPWNIDTFSQHLQQADVGIMPLRNTLWERGKCGYKLLQYAATGLPMLGSPVGVNKKILSDLGGIAVSQENDWLDSILDLKNSTSTDREKMGRYSREHVQSLYSYETWSNEWSSIVNG
ncbi:MAG: glycosyltransferase [Micrococcaceae bacterium]